MTLFFIAYTDDDGTNQDYFVRATSVYEAIRWWFENELGAYSYDGFNIIPEGEGQVFTVPDQDGPEGVVGWDHHNAVRFAIF